MTSDREDAGVEMSRRMLLWVFGITLLCGIPIAWCVWEVLGVIFYVDGLFNSAFAFGIGPVLFPAVFVVGILLSRRSVLRHLRRFGYDTRWMRRGVLAILIVSVIAASVGLARLGLLHAPLSMFARGIARYVERRADLGAIQNWLGTLDTDDCQDQRLGEKIAPSRTHPEPPKYVPVPVALAGMKGHHIILSKDDEGRPMVRVFLGGSGMIGHWGITVGLPDMPVPPSDESDFGESRFPLAPGAYVWHAE